ncbi:MAG: universal stress protein [Gemmataceae bacterium]
MFQSILVPLDGSTFGEHALPLAMALARRSKAELKLLHVHAPLKSVYLEGAAFIDESIESDIKASQRAYLEVVAERVGQVCDTKIVPKLLDGEIAEAIAEEAMQGGTDLVVMTTHGKSALGRFWLGSTTDELVRHLPMPLLIVRPQEVTPDLTIEPSLKHILIALDGSEHSEAIIESATKLGQLMESDYTLVRIIKPVMPVNAPVEATTAVQAFQAVVDRVEGIQKQLAEEASKYLESVAGRLRASGLQVNTRVDLDDQPASAIIKEGERDDVDMIAIETHARRGFSRLFLGSVADKVLRGATVPVLIHRPQEK